MRHRRKFKDGDEVFLVEVALRGDDPHAADAIESITLQKLNRLDGKFRDIKEEKNDYTPTEPK